MKYIARLTNIFTVLLVFLLGYCVFIIQPILHDGLFVTHDSVQVPRIEAMYNELKGGQFPVRYVDAFGNGGGYMLFNFYSPLAYYIGAFFHALGLPLIKATKMVFLLAFGIGGAGVAGLSYAFTKNKALSLLSVYLLLSSPYFLYNTFHRGALAELLGFSLIPWVLLCFYQVKNSSSKLWIILGGLSFGLMIYAHVLTALATGVVIALFCVADLAKYKQFILKIIATLLLGTGIAASFFLPGLLEKQYIIYESIGFVESGYKTSSMNLLDILGRQQPTPTLGVVLTVASILFLFFVIKRKAYSSNNIFIVLSFVVLILLVTPLSDVAWEHLSVLRLMQFKYRLLTVLTMVSILACLTLLQQLKQKKLLYFWIGLILIISAVQSQLYATPTAYNMAGVYKAEGPCATTGWDDEHLGYWTEECLPLNESRPIVSETVPGELHLTELKQEKNGRLISFTTDTAGEVVLNKYYFPGWVAKSNGIDSLNLEPYTKHGLLKVVVPEGSNSISVAFTDTPIRKLGNFITLVSCVIAVVWGVYILCKEKYLVKARTFLTKKKKSV